MLKSFSNGPAGRLEGRLSAWQGKEAPIASWLHPQSAFAAREQPDRLQLFLMFSSADLTRSASTSARFGRSQANSTMGGRNLPDVPPRARLGAEPVHPDSKSCWVAVFLRP